MHSRRCNVRARLRKRCICIREWAACTASVSTFAQIYALPGESRELSAMKIFARRIRRGDEDDDEDDVFPRGEILRAFIRSIRGEAHEMLSLLRIAFTRGTLLEALLRPFLIN